MTNFSDKQVAEYFRRSYAAIDGLWFMKVENCYGFEIALEVDADVWKVLPKIQARAMKSLKGLGNGIQDLCEAIITRLTWEGFEFQIERDLDGFSIIITKCLWQERMIKSGRKHLLTKNGRQNMPFGKLYLGFRDWN
ncbi:MAG: DUF6125 family protein [Methanotrichaceae archaeon]|nr:DUF6125 family protein [Methanotrichaceae archaeon]